MDIDGYMSLVKRVSLPSSYAGAKNRPCGLEDFPNSGYLRLLQEPSIVLYGAYLSHFIALVFLQCSGGRYCP